jgi:hypothetical protein
MKKRKYCVKEAGVLLIAIVMCLSITVTADIETNETPTLFAEGSGQSQGALGPVVWDNGMDYDGVAAAQFDEEYPFEAECADDFNFEEDTLVGDVHWIGAYWQTNYNQVHWPWEIIFYKDDGSGNKPGALYAGPYNFDSTQYTETLVEDTGSTIYYEISVDLPENVVCNAGQKYWISIQGIGVFPPQSGWGYHLDPIYLHEAVFRSEFFGHPDWTDWSIVDPPNPRDLCFQLTEGEGCEPSIDVEKYVKGPCGDWVDADTEDEALDLPICTDAIFKIVIHNDGTCCGPLFNIYVYDVMHDSLKFISADPEPEEFAYDPPYYYMLWTFPGPLEPCETIEIYITAHVEGPECSLDFNYVEVYAMSDCEPYYLDDFDWAYVHAFENKPPDAPKIDGPSEGKAGETLNFTFHSTDPNGDPVRYVVDWGDGSPIETTDCYPSCTPVGLTHTYANDGTYIIKAKAIDCCWGLEGPGSEHEIKIPRARSVYHPIILKLLERFPNVFPILRQLLNL